MCITLLLKTFKNQKLDGKVSFPFLGNLLKALT